MGLVAGLLVWYRWRDCTAWSWGWGDGSGMGFVIGDLAAGVLVPHDEWALWRCLVGIAPGRVRFYLLRRVVGQPSWVLVFVVVWLRFLWARMGSGSAVRGSSAHCFQPGGQVGGWVVLLVQAVTWAWSVAWCQQEAWLGGR